MARALVGIREWLPNLKDVTGRGIEVCLCVYVCGVYFTCVYMCVWCVLTCVFVCVCVCV